MVQDYEVKLITKEEIAPRIWSYRFAIPEGQTIDFTAGQYMLLKVEGNYRQYSIASSDTIHNSFDLIVETVDGGLGSNYLQHLPIGEVAHFKGPAGVFTLKDSTKNKIFLATGTGIAPVKSMIESYFSRESHNASITLLFGLKDRKNTYLFNEFKQLSVQNPNFHFRMCLSKEEQVVDLEEEYFRTGRVNAYLTELLAVEKEIVVSSEFYICGSKQAVDSLKEFVAQLGVPAEHIFFERFTI